MEVEVIRDAAHMYQVRLNSKRELNYTFTLDKKESMEPTQPITSAAEANIMEAVAVNLQILG